MTDLLALADRVEKPVLTLWQPYASLIFEKPQIKFHETRSWRLPEKFIGQRVAIHSAAACPSQKKLSDQLHELCMEVYGCSYNYTLPLGCILGTVRFGKPFNTNGQSPHNDDDNTAGDFRDGRFAWTCEEPVKFERPILAKGKQGFWYCEISAQFCEAQAGGGA